MADVTVTFGANIQAMVDGIKGVQGEIEKLTGPLNDTEKAFRKIGDAIAGAFLVDQIKEFVTGMAELGEQTQKTADIFGTTTQEVGLLNFAAAETGGSGEALMRSLERLSESLAQAQSHATPTGAAIRALGLDAKTLSELPLPELLDQLRQKFSDLEPGMQRTAIAQALVRSGAESLLPVLEMSTEKWADLRATFEATGAAMSPGTAAAFAETSDKITTFRAAIEGLGERIFAVLKPAIDALLGWLTNLAERIDGPTIRSAVSSLVLDIGSIVKAIGDMAIDVGGQLGLLEGKLDGIARKAALISGGAAVGAMGGSLLGGVGAIPGAAVGGLVGLVGANTMDDLDTFNGNLQAQVNHTSAVKAQFDQLMTGLQSSIQNGLARMPGNSEETVGDRAQQLRDALGGAGGTSLNFGPAGGLTAAQKEYDAIVKSAQQAAEKTQQYWDKVGETIASSLVSATSAVLRGTETIQQALMQLGEQALQSIATSALKAIISYAGQAFAGTFAMLSGTMGPAAIGPASTAEEVVLAQANPLGLAVGTWNVSEDANAIVHQGEVVMPKFESGMFRQAMATLAGGGAPAGAPGPHQGGDTHNHFHGAILDGRELLRQLGAAKRLNPSLA